MFMRIFYAFLRSLSYRGKVIIKGISNIIRIRYIIKGEYSWHSGYYSFQRNEGFDSFPYVLNIFPISFKIFNMIIMLTDLRISLFNFKNIGSS